jgi:antitoxin (DNA-binding transcriptional repressor) of toxin-antitoxin stability system
METVNVSSLKNNPSDALRRARQGVVVVLNRDEPDALMVGIQQSGVLDECGVRPALATALFRDGFLSLARGARLANMAVGQFVSHLSRLGVPVIALNAEETGRDMETLDAWLGRATQ